MQYDQATIATHVFCPREVPRDEDNTIEADDTPEEDIARDRVDTVA